LRAPQTGKSDATEPAERARAREAAMSKKKRPERSSIPTPYEKQIEQMFAPQVTEQELAAISGFRRRKTLLRFIPEGAADRLFSSLVWLAFFVAFFAFLVWIAPDVICDPACQDRYLDRWHR
jgi:hypothetical protein